MEACSLTGIVLPGRAGSPTHLSPSIALKRASGSAGPGRPQSRRRPGGDSPRSFSRAAPPCSPARGLKPVSSCLARASCGAVDPCFKVPRPLSPRFLSPATLCADPSPAKRSPSPSDLGLTSLSRAYPLHSPRHKASAGDGPQGPLAREEGTGDPAAVDEKGSASGEEGKREADGGVPDAVGPTAETTPLVRLAWYASEAFGKAVAVFRQPGGEEGRTEASLARGAALPRDEAILALRDDYSRSYFVTGAMTMELYEPECEFADPFVSFRGRDRFKQNVSNLGSFMEDVSLKILDWQEDQDKVTTKWRFSCVLGLPWRPILAASGGTDHFFDRSTGRIVKHVERWDISPMDGLKQLIKPNPKFRQQKK